MSQDVSLEAVARALFAVMPDDYDGDDLAFAVLDRLIPKDVQGNAAMQAWVATRPPIVP